EKVTRNVDFETFNTKLHCPASYVQKLQEEHGFRPALGKNKKQRMGTFHTLLCICCGVRTGRAPRRRSGCPGGGRRGGGPQARGRRRAAQGARCDRRRCGGRPRPAAWPSRS